MSIFYNKNGNMRKIYNVYNVLYDSIVIVFESTMYCCKKCIIMYQKNV